MSIFNLPDLGEGLPDAEISQWHVKVGDTVKADEPLVAMETAKAVVEVPAPRSGKIVKLYGKPGDIIKTGAPLVEFAEEEGKPKPSAAKAGAATVAGAIEVGNTILQESATGITPTAHVTPPKAIPAIRALAKKLGVDLSKVTATGDKGQITAEDVQNFAASKGTAEPIKQISIQGEIQSLRGVRRAMANAMTQSHSEVVPVTLVDDADIHAWTKTTDITWRVIHAIVQGCKKEPSLNAHFDFKKLERKLFSAINIGIAVDSEEGLFVPVLKNAEKLTQKQFRDQLARFKEQIKKRSLAPEDLSDCTIQLSNFGTFAGRYANPILVPPIVAILGIGKIRDEVVAMNGMIAIHRIMPLSLTIEHRAVTGGEAARFLKAVIDDLTAAE